MPESAPPTPPLPANGAFTELVLAPLLPWPLLAVLAAVLLALVSWAAWRRARGVWARLAAGVVLLVVLLNPQGVTERRAPLPDVAVVAVDESFSNTLADRPSKPARPLTPCAPTLAEDPHRDPARCRWPTARPIEGTRLMQAPCGRPWRMSRRNAAPGWWP